MDKSSLESFIAIAEKKSFSRAAEKLHITQPAISKRLASLELQLNAQLIDRIGKTARLTHSGEVLYHHAKQLLEAMETCKTEINNLNEAVTGTLSIALSHHIAQYRIPVPLKIFANKFAQVKLSPSFVDSSSAFDMIKSGEVEIALATLQPKKPDNIIQTPIWRDPLCFVVGAQHSLTRKNADKPLSLQELCEFTALLPKSLEQTRENLNRLLIQAKSKPIHTIEANSLDNIKMMTKIGLGWTLLPRTMIDNELKGLVMNIENPKRQLGLIHLEHRTLSNAAKAFIQILRQYSG